VANRDKTSPPAAGLEEVTTEKSAEWVTAGPRGVNRAVGVADIVAINGLIVPIGVPSLFNLRRGHRD